VKPFIVPVFIPHSGCPHQCAFCNQKAISGQKAEKISNTKVREQINRFLAFPRDEHRTVQISFYGAALLGRLLEKSKAPLRGILRFIYIPYEFCSLNIAAVVALLVHLSGGKDVRWEKLA